MTVIDSMFCLGMRVINRSETRFSHHVPLEWDCWQL